MQKFLILILLVSIQSLLVFRPVLASECKKTVKSESKSVLSQLAKETEIYRNQRMTSSGGQFLVKGVKYTVIGLLGKSSSPAYLVKDNSGTLFVLKEIKSDDDNPNWAFSANYEAAATQFYAELGFIIPKIVAVQYTKEIGKHTVALLVKEYRPGITAGELEALQYSFNKFWASLSKRKLKQLNLSLTEYRNAHKNFHSWLIKNNIILFEKGFEQLNEFIRNGDIYEHNMLLDAQTGQWILFDP